MTKWLEDHPIANADDVAFLKCEIENWKWAATKAAKDSEEETQQLTDIDGAAKKHKSWSGRHPYLRLTHALVDHDNIKAAYIQHGDLPSGRMAAENQNTEETKAFKGSKCVADVGREVE